MENNPNLIDSLFTPRNCVLHSTPIAERVREKRKMEIKTPQEGSKRARNVEKFGFDVKFAYHIVRLLDEAEQILTLGDLDLTRDAERTKEFFTRRERELETAYAESKLPHGSNETEIRALLAQIKELCERAGL